MEICGKGENHHAEEHVDRECEKGDALERVVLGEGKYLNKTLLTLSRMVGFEVIMMFGGSPTGVAVPPMLACTTIAMRIGTGFRSKSSQSVIVIGAIRRTVVTLSSSIETKHVMMHKQ